MVSEEDIREQGLTSEDVIDREFIQPEETPTEAYWPDYFDDHPESRPGENTRLWEDENGNPGVLVWDDGEFEVNLTAVEKDSEFPVGDWRATIHVPEKVGAHFVNEHEIKCRYPPTLGDDPMGYVEDVEMSDRYVTQTITLRLYEPEGMPLVSVENYPDMLREEAEAAQEYANEVQGKLDAAKENEE